MTSPLLWLPGTNGLLISAPLVLLDGSDTGFNGLASGASVTSSAHGPASNGIFNQSVLGSGIWAYMQLTLGTMAALGNGSVASGFFLKTLDNGASFDVADADNPHFYFNLPTTSITAGTKRPAMGQLIRVPAVPFKVQFQQFNGNGVAFAASGNVLTIATVAPAA